ncbi:MAG: hypothetical protein JJT95_01675 [Pararhodobacter sp.]|nr:hypothetical protein [Pararhodobacter sp.]
MLCARDTQFESLHVGPAPVTLTGDYLIGFFMDAEGRRAFWAEVPRIDDAEIRELTREIFNRLNTFHLRVDETRLMAWFAPDRIIMSSWLYK